MDNAENVYGNFAGLMRGLGSMDNPETLVIGQVKSTGSKFEIEIDGLILDDDDLYVAEYLKTPYVTSVNFGSETTTKCNLKKGDLVACMQCSDNDTYVVLCKVVKP